MRNKIHITLNLPIGIDVTEGPDGKPLIWRIFTPSAAEVQKTLDQMADQLSQLDCVMQVHFSMNLSPLQALEILSDQEVYPRYIELGSQHPETHLAIERFLVRKIRGKVTKTSSARTLSFRRAAIAAGYRYL